MSPPAEISTKREPSSSCSSPESPPTSSFRYALGLDHLILTGKYSVVNVGVPCCYRINTFSLSCRVYERKSISTERYIVIKTFFRKSYSPSYFNLSHGLTLAFLSYTLSLSGHFKIIALTFILSISLLLLLSSILKIYVFFADIVYTVLSCYFLSV